MTRANVHKRVPNSPAPSSSTAPPQASRSSGAAKGVRKDVAPRGNNAAVQQQPSNEELAVLQSTELDVLASILGDDFSRVDADAQSAWQQASATLASSSSSSSSSSTSSFQVLIRPDTESLKAGVYATTRFRLPIRYPFLPPIITVLTGNKSFRGLSDQHVKGLQHALTTKAKELAGGSEMLWDVISFAQEYISTHNLEYFAGPSRSLEEEKRLRDVARLSAMKKEAQEESRKRTKEEEERAAKIAQLIREQSERNTVAMQQVKERKRDATAFSPSESQLMDYLDENHASDRRSGGQRTELFMDPIEDDGKITHQVVVGPLISDTAICSTYLVHSAQDPNGRAWQMDVYDIETPYYSLSSGKKALQDVEWELDKLRSLRADTLVNVRACALVSHESVGRQSTKRLLVVHDILHGPTVETLLSHGVRMPWSRVRYYLRDVVNALDALHGSNLLHRDVTAANVFLEGRPGVQATAKLARGGYAPRLRDMNASHPIRKQLKGIEGARAALNHGWEAPESIGEEGARTEDAKHPYTRKHDVWQTGIVALQMLFGLDVTTRFKSPHDLLDESGSLLDMLGSHVVAFLKSMMETSARKRPTVSELRGRLDEIIRYEDEEQSSSASNMVTTFDSDKAARQKLDPPRRGLTRTTSEREDPFRPGSFWQLSRGRFNGNASRYENDFEELDLLGKGAYGAVFRARNRLDGRDYAIKKIRLSASAENDERTLREITALSRLSHQNIVRYVTCWIQVQDDPFAASSAEETVTSTMLTSSLNVGVPGINDDFLSVGHDAFSNSASHVHFGSSDSDEESCANGKRTAHVEEMSDSSSSEEDEDDDDDDNDDGGTDMHQSQLQQSFSMSAGPALPSQPRWLFIQMEYVENQTLREAIDRGMSVDDAWRLFRQMLEALAHVASLGIIHRDLKPSNILMYRNLGSTASDGSVQATTIGDLKIGDFGLATTTPGQQQQSGNVDTMHNAFGAADESVEQTTEVGTNLYIAPEVLKTGASRYDYKVDVYAAGIVFFEMLASNRVYKTGMERIQVLRDLRSPDVQFPQGWDEVQLSAQTKILRRMLSHDPNERPGPLELLKSDLLPPKMEDEYIAECMRLLSMPNSTYNLQLMESLFERKETFEEREARDFTFDAGSNEGQGLDNRFIGIASQYLRTLFHRRGAVELEAPLLLPPNDLYETEQTKPVELVDKTGKVVQLPYDLVVPFARLVARGEQQRFKRYAIAPVYRPNLLAGGQPRSVIEVDFDIVSPEKTPAAEAEVLGVLDEILDDVPGLNASEWVVQISHGTVLELLLERIPSNRRDQVVAAIAKLTSSLKSTASQGRIHLSSLGLTRSVTDEIDSANLSDDIDVVYEKLQRLIAMDLRPRLKRAVDAIRRVIEAAQQFGVQRRFLFTPLLVSNAAFYRDNVYFVVTRARGKRRDVLASGGRYDALLKRFSSPTLTRAPAHAVGVQIALGRIAVALAKHQEMLNNAGEERSLGSFTPRRCDVYVASAPGLLSTRMEICRELWAANISADLTYEHSLEESPELLASTCRAEGILFLVFARSRGSVVKVKAIVSRTEYEVHRWELASWLADRIHRMRTNAAEASMLSGLPHLASAGATAERINVNSTAVATLSTSASMQNAGEVDVILPERQHDKRRVDKHGFNDTRRGRKQAHLAPMQEKAARQVAKLLEEMTAGTGVSSSSGGGATKLPILAVDVSTGPSPTTAVSSSSTSMQQPFSASSLSSASLPSTSSSSFTLLCAAATARHDDTLWRMFIDSLAHEEREYGKQIRKRIVDLDGRRAWLVSVRSAEGGVAFV